MVDFRLGFPTLIRAHAFGSGLSCIWGLLVDSILFSFSIQIVLNLYLHCDVCLYSVLSGMREERGIVLGLGEVHKLISSYILAASFTYYQGTLITKMMSIS